MDSHGNPSPFDDALKTDPVCGMRVRPEKAKFRWTHAGIEYYFCAEICYERFKTNPAAHLSGAASAPSLAMDDPFAVAAPAARTPPSPRAGTRKANWYCPMCEGIESDVPGDCPKCGMALEPAPGARADGADDEFYELRTKLLLTIAFGAPVVILGMSSMAVAGGGEWPGYVQFILASIVIFGPGFFLIKRGFAGARRIQLNMFTLIAIGVIAAYIESAIATFAPSLIPEESFHGGARPFYYDSAAAIVILVIAGQLIESRARTKASGAIRGLLQLRPDIAHRVRTGGDEDIPVDAVRVGDILRVKPGERVPADGMIVEGGASIDESAISGEPIPVDKQTKDRVLASTGNTTGSFLFRVERVGSEMFISRIIACTREAIQKRPPIARAADRVTQWFVPAVILCSILTFVGWFLFGPQTSISAAIYNSIAVLVFACPCALGLATPMAIVVAAGRAARGGIVVRDAAALERAAAVQTVIIDKTGTLTEGRPVVRALIPCDGTTESELLTIAAGVEKNSEHPIARAILAAAAAKNVRVAECHDFRAVPGSGARARMHNITIFAGTPGFAKNEGADFSNIDARLSGEYETGATVIYIAAGSKALGAISIADRIRDGARAAVERLRKNDITIVMATGDDRRAAEAVARELNITEIHARADPMQKAKLIETIRASGRVVAMAGDGINDAPALAAADVGIAMGGGSDIAIESAPLTILKGDIAALARIFVLSRKTMRVIRQNLFWAFIYNIAGLPLAAGLGAVAARALGSEHASQFMLLPVWAAVAMVSSSLIVILNSLRLAKA